MINIRKDELRFLNDLSSKLSLAHEVSSEDASKLLHIVNRLNEAREKENRKVAELVARKRKSDPTYGRSSAEKERLMKKEYD